MIKDQNEKNKIKDQIVHLAFIIFLGLNSILSSQSNILTFYYSLSTLFRLFSFFSFLTLLSLYQTHPNIILINFNVF